LANGDRIFLRKFHSSKVDEFVDWAVSNDLVGDQLHATGGGAYKYAEQLEKAFPLTRIYKHDEM
jgi:pantothenate kinase